MARTRPALIVIGCLLGWPAAAHAGMARPTTVLTEVGRMRLQNLSFFLAGFLVSALLVQLVWNYLRRDFAFLPRLSYPRAVGLVGLWGLLFVLVLTMIAGARELMTPGAWEPQGISYRLTQPAAAPPDESPEDERRQQLARLKEALWRYARDHGGSFPPSRSDPAVPGRLWRLPDHSGLRYVYAGGAATPFDGVPLAYEPDVYPERWVLFSDGEVRRMTSGEIARALAGGKK
jgi:hypothetical protein